jgi:tetratricopeptide (TPR) repeat protein
MSDAATDSPVAVLLARYEALSTRLDQVKSGADLDPIKADIGALFKVVEREIAELTALKASTLALIERWKSARSNHTPPQAAGAMMPHLSGTYPVVSDHIGASTFVEKGWSRLSAGDYEGAEESLTKALALSPNNPHAESLLGWAQMRQQKFDQALLNFQRVLVREPQNSLARINVGYICLKKHIFGEAIEHLSRAIRLDNDKQATLYAHFYMGLVYLERDMFEDAQTFFQKTLALGPNLIEAYYELGRAYWFNGQRDEAMQTWQSGCVANKFNPWGKRCAEVLEVVKAGGEP